MEPERNPRADSFDTRKTMESLSSFVAVPVVKKTRVSPVRDTVSHTRTTSANATTNTKAMSYWKTLIEKVKLYDIKRRVPIIQRFLPRLIKKHMDDLGERSSKSSSEIRHSKSGIQNRPSRAVSPLSLSKASFYSNLSIAVPEYGPEEKISHKIHCKNMNKQLALEAGVKTYVQDTEKELNDSWEPPSEAGLGNSNVILPKYYFSGSLQKVFQMDYLEVIIDDIRNVRPLNSYQLQYIAEKCSEKEKQRIIVEFNSVFEAYGSVFKDTTDN